MKRGLILISVLLVVVVSIFVAAGKAAHRHMESIRCGDSMITIGYSSHLWAAEHDGHLPADFQSLSNQLRATYTLICPGDHVRQAAADWASFTTNNSTYEIAGAGLTVTNGRSLYLRCKEHGFVLLANGLVYDGTRRISR